MLIIRYKDKVGNKFFVVDTEVESLLSRNSCTKLDRSRSTIQVSGAGGLSRIVHWIRMFALRFSHRARRRSCSCSPCPKEGTCSTESKVVKALKMTEKLGVIVHRKNQLNGSTHLL